MSNIKNRKESGFTIIEVLIVLAIAGLIMLIVFLAVPALQRNSRNTQRKNDAATYLSAVNEYVNNANGKVLVTGDVSAINNLANLGFLTEPTTLAAGAQTTAVGIDSLQLVGGAKCGSGGDSVAGSTRQFVVRFSVEDSSGNAVKQCQEG